MKRKLHTADSRMRLVILWIYIAILCRSISRPFSDRFAINNATISAALVGHVPQCAPAWLRHWASNFEYHFWFNLQQLF